MEEPSGWVGKRSRNSESLGIEKEEAGERSKLAWVQGHLDAESDQWQQNRDGFFEQEEENRHGRVFKQDWVALETQHDTPKKIGYQGDFLQRIAREVQLQIDLHRKRETTIYFRSFCVERWELWPKSENKRTEGQIKAVEWW